MIMKLFLGCSQYISPAGPEWFGQPEENDVLLIIPEPMDTWYGSQRWWWCQWSVKPEEKEDDFNSTDDGESSQESHGASNQT